MLQGEGAGWRRGNCVVGRVEGDGTGIEGGKGDLLLADGGSDMWAWEKRRGKKGKMGWIMGELEEPQGDLRWSLEAWKGGGRLLGPSPLPRPLNILGPCCLPPPPRPLHIPGEAGGLLGSLHTPEALGGALPSSMLPSPPPRYLCL